MGVTHHRILWSPDFPPAARRRVERNSLRSTRSRATGDRPVRSESDFIIPRRADKIISSETGRQESEVGSNLQRTPVSRLACEPEPDRNDRAPVRKRTG